MEWTHRNDSAAGETLDDRCVLIVDDDRDCLRLLHAWFVTEGFGVACAANGDEALALLQSKPFCLMLTDYNMPGMNGLRLSEEALKTDPGLAIIMVTASSVRQLHHIAAETGICAVLAKPFDIEELLRIVHRESRRTTQPPRPATRPESVNHVHRELRS